MDRVGKMLEKPLVSTFNKLDFERTDQKAEAVEYVLYSSTAEPMDEVKKIEADGFNNNDEVPDRNSSYYIKKLVAGLLTMDYSIVGADEKIKKMREV